MRGELGLDEVRVDPFLWLAEHRCRYDGTRFHAVGLSFAPNVPGPGDAPAAPEPSLVFRRQPVGGLAPLPLVRALLVDGLCDLEGPVP